MSKRTVHVSLMFLTTFMGAFVFNCGNDGGSTGPEDPTVPIVTTAIVSDKTQTTAQSGGTVISDGGTSVTARGVCWDTSSVVTAADSKTTDGLGMGSFSSSITGLTAKTFYYIRAYAINGAGTGYGEIRSFSTDSVCPNPTSTVTDIDGNVYQTVKIGDQWWMAENLRVTHYRNGDPIPHVADSADWHGLSTGAHCTYNNHESHAGAYGRLYNWHAVHDSRSITPEGWHMPTDEEWKQLEMCLGMSQTEADYVGTRGTDEGGKLKDVGTTYWFSPNAGATNESGFSAMPGGFRRSDGSFDGMYLMAIFWSSTVKDPDSVWLRGLYTWWSTIYRWDSYGTGPHYGYSVRCVRD